MIAQRTPQTHTTRARGTHAPHLQDANGRERVITRARRRRTRRAHAATPLTRAHTSTTCAFFSVVRTGKPSRRGASATHAKDIAGHGDGSDHVMAYDSGATREEPSSQPSPASAGARV